MLLLLWHHKLMMPWKLANWDSWEQWGGLLIQWSFINCDTEIQSLELLPPTWTLILVWRYANVMWLEAFWHSYIETCFLWNTLGICFEKKPKIPQGETEREKEILHFQLLLLTTDSWVRPFCMFQHKPLSDYSCLKDAKETNQLSNITYLILSH